jgi:sugar lactone lactonase YvrE
MGKQAEDGAGAIYHIAGSSVTRIVERISIPNGICFSPDGTKGYFVDSKVNHYMQFDVNPETGLPKGPARLWADTSSLPGSTDGSVMAKDGTIWNARWGAGEVHHYAADGTVAERYAVPMKQVTCPAIYGSGANRLFLTSAWEHMTDDQRAADPLNGTSFDLGVTISGQFEPAFRVE